MKAVIQIFIQDTGSLVLATIFTICVLLFLGIKGFFNKLREPEGRRDVVDRWKYGWKVLGGMFVDGPTLLSTQEHRDTMRDIENHQRWKKEWEDSLERRNDELRKKFGKNTTARYAK